MSDTIIYTVRIPITGKALEELRTNNDTIRNRHNGEFGVSCSKFGAFASCDMFLHKNRPKAQEQMMAAMKKVGFKPKEVASKTGLPVVEASYSGDADEPYCTYQAVFVK